MSSCKRRDGSATPEPMEVHVQERKFEKFERKTSVTNRMSYVEATTEGDNMWKRSTERLEASCDACNSAVHMCTCKVNPCIQWNLS